MFSDAKDLKLCEEEKIELDLYRGIYLHPTDSGIETDDDRRWKRIILSALKIWQKGKWYGMRR